MGAVPASLSAYHVPAWCMQKLEESVRFPRTGVPAAVGCHVGATIQIPVLWKCSQGSQLLIHLSSSRGTYFRSRCLLYSDINASSPSLCYQGHMNPNAWTVHLEVAPWRVSGTQPLNQTSRVWILEALLFSSVLLSISHDLSLSKSSIQRGTAFIMVVW